MALSSVMDLRACSRRAWTSALVAAGWALAGWVAGPWARTGEEKTTQLAVASASRDRMMGSFEVWRIISRLTRPQKQSPAGASRRASGDQWPAGQDYFLGATVESGLAFMSVVLPGVAVVVGVWVSVLVGAG